MTPNDPLRTFAAHTAAQPADLTRLRARVRAASPSSPAPWASRLPWVMVGGLAAALSLLVVWPAEPAPLDQSLSTSAMAQEVVPGVLLTANGLGRLDGTATAPVITWASGQVAVSVEPGAGLDVRVQTDEAEVHVVGTEFSVVRDGLGTTTSVSRGKVEVRCANEDSPTIITASESRACWPTTAAGLLGRARHLQGQSAPSDTILPTVERGLALSDSDAVYTELSALNVELLYTAGRVPDAIAAARAHLQNPSAGRRVDVARLGAALAYSLEGCTGAMPFLADLPSEEIASSALGVCPSAEAPTP